MQILYEVFAKNNGAFGGTEYMVDNFKEKILPETPQLLNYLNIVFPGMSPQKEVLFSLKNIEVICWMHNTLVQFHPMVKEIFSDPRFFQRIKNIVVVSEYHRATMIKEMPWISPEKFVVIPNAINMLTPKAHKFEDVGKVKIIHASSADRGMEMLLKALPHIKEDFELNIFNDYYPDTDSRFRDLINDPRINLYGKTPRKTVYKYFEESHIHAYPSTYPETSCLTQMEALSAGCYSIHTNLGALPETSLGYGTMIPIEELTPERYAEEISKAIRMIKTSGYNYQKQVRDISNTFSWDNAKQNWIKLAQAL